MIQETIRLQHVTVHNVSDEPLPFLVGYAPGVMLAPGTYCTFTEPLGTDLELLLSYYETTKSITVTRIETEINSMRELTPNELRERAEEEDRLTLETWGSHVLSEHVTTTRQFGPGLARYLLKDPSATLRMVELAREFAQRIAYVRALHDTEGTWQGSLPTAEVRVELTPDRLLTVPVLGTRDVFNERSSLHRHIYPVWDEGPDRGGQQRVCVHGSSRAPRKDMLTFLRDWSGTWGQDIRELCQKQGWNPSLALARNPYEPLLALFTTPWGGYSNVQQIFVDPVRGSVEIGVLL